MTKSCNSILQKALITVISPYLSPELDRPSSCSLHSAQGISLTFWSQLYYPSLNMVKIHSPQCTPGISLELSPMTHNISLLSEHHLWMDLLSWTGLGRESLLWCTDLGSPLPPLFPPVCPAAWLHSLATSHHHDLTPVLPTCNGPTPTKFPLKNSCLSLQTLLNVMVDTMPDI